MQTARLTIPDWLAPLDVAGMPVAELWRARLARLGWAPGPDGPELDGRRLAVSDAALADALARGVPLPAPCVETPADLPDAERALVRELVRALIASGVRVYDPDRLWVEASVEVAPGAVLWGGAVLRGRTRIGPGATVEPGAVLTDTEVGERAVVRPYTVCDRARIGPECAVGPMAHLRPGAVLLRDVKVGNFVEVKQATLHPGVRASHLTYLGDAEVGEGANIGAGTITCNYDGFGKHRTEIGAGAFVGSNTSLVAPIRIGRGAIVGAGSTLSRDVPDESLAVERAEERVLEGRAPRVRQRNRIRAGKE